MATSYQTIDPSSGQVIQEFGLLDHASVNAKLQRSHEAFLEWKTWSFDKRATIFNRIADDLTANATAYAQTMTLEMGKPLAEGEAEVKKCALACRYFAHNSASFLAPRNR